jgi:ABC-type branched-subunit amino acid transport system substrate-binding protein
MARSNVSRTAAVLTLVLAASTSLAACTGDDAPPPREPAAVGLKTDSPDDLKIGVLVSSTSDPGEGADYLGPSAGADLAAYRLKLGGTKVALTVVDDQGDADEAKDGIQTLVDRGVSGIVLATSGAHVLPALQTAAGAGVPVVAPYLRTEEDLPDGVFVTGPSEDAISAGIEQAMSADEVSAPTVVTADDAPVPAVGDAVPVDYTGDNLDSLVGKIAKAAKKKRTDSVVVSASARSQGRVVAALQGAVPDLPVYLTPEALTPAFTDELDEADGAPSGRFVTIGAPASDTSTLGSGSSAESAAAYFAALRLASDDTSFTSGFDHTVFSDVAAVADLPSHDAVLALVRASAAAKSSDPDKVVAALAGLKIGVAQALAGPALDFTSSHALPDSAVVPLHATTQDAGVRPAGDTPSLTWFDVPSDDA